MAIQPLRDGTDLRDNVQVAMAAFKENCGLAPISNIKQCLRMLVSRISSSCDNASLQISMKGDVSFNVIKYIYIQSLAIITTLFEFVANGENYWQNFTPLHPSIQMKQIKDFFLFQYPYLEAQGNIPESLKKALVAFENVSHVFFLYF